MTEDELNNRKTWPISKEECWCCKHGHPPEKEVYDAGAYDQDMCYDCNFGLCPSKKWSETQR